MKKILFILSWPFRTYIDVLHYEIKRAAIEVARNIKDGWYEFQRNVYTAKQSKK